MPLGSFLCSRGSCEISTWLHRGEFPQGTAPDRADSDPLELAHRELTEETGLRADALTLLGLLDTAPGVSSQRGRVFLATELTEGQPERELTEQDMRTAWFSRAEVVGMRIGESAERIFRFVILRARQKIHGIVELPLGIGGPVGGWRRRGSARGYLAQSAGRRAT